MKTRVSFTIDSDIIAKLDSIVDNIVYRSRSEAVEEILRKFFEKQSVALIVCGGEFKLADSDIYKPLAKIGDRTVIEGIVELLRKNGFRNVLITGKTDLLKEIFKLIGNGDGLGVNVKYFDDNNLLGSAKALEVVKPYLSATTLFVPGDEIFNFDLKEMVAFHRENNNLASIAIVNNPLGQSVKDRIAIRGSKVISYERLRSMEVSKLVPTSIMLFEPDIIKYIPPGNIRWSIHQDLLPQLSKDGLLIGYISNGEWINIHSTQDLEAAREILNKALSKL